MRISVSLKCLLYILLPVQLCSIPAAAQNASPKLRETGVPISNLLDSVREKTGEKLWCSQSIAEERLVVLCDPTDIESLRKGIDLLPGYQWLSGKLPDGSAFYILGADNEEREEWKKLAEKTSAEHDRLIAEIAKKRMKEYFQALSYSDDQLDAMGEEDPGLVLELSGSPKRPFIELLACLPDEALDQALHNRYRPVSISWAQGNRDRMLKALRDIHGLQTRRLAEAGKESNLPDVEEFCRLILQSGELKMEGYGADDGLVGSIYVPSPSGEKSDALTGFYGLMRPRWYSGDSSYKQILKKRGVPEEQIEALMKSANDSMGRRWDETEKRTLESMLKNYPPRFGSRKAPDGKLGPEPVPDITYLDAPEVCEKHELNYFSHFLEKQAGKHKSAGLCEDMGLGEAFDRMTEAVKEFDRHIWAYQDGSVFHVCSSFVDALESEIPAAILARYRSRAALNGGYLTLDDAAGLAGEITQKQAINVPRDIWRICLSIRFNWADLRFYGSLDALQRKTVFAEGLSYDSLSKMQRLLLDKVIQSHYSSMGEVSAAVTQSFRIMEKPVDKGIFQTLEFTYVTKDSDPVVRHIMVQIKPRELKPGEEVVPDYTLFAEIISPLPDGPPAVKAAGALAEWNYAGIYVKEGQQPQARLRRKKGDLNVRRLLKVGDILDDAKLTKITAETVTFDYNGATLLLPIRKAVHLEPYDPKALGWQLGYEFYNATADLPVVQKR